MRSGRSTTARRGTPDQPRRHGHRDSDRARRDHLQSSDRIEHASKGAIGALIIEPPNAIISEFDSYRRAVATISGGTEGSGGAHPVDLHRVKGCPVVVRLPFGRGDQPDQRHQLGGDRR